MVSKVQVRLTYGKSTVKYGKGIALYGIFLVPTIHVSKEVAGVKNQLDQMT